MKTAFEAPLLNASIPRFPVPANTSRTFESMILGAIILNRASFTLSEVGRVESPLIVFSLWFFAVPEITLKIFYHHPNKLNIIIQGLYKNC